MSPANRDQVYFVSRARVNIAKKQFNNVNNDYEIAFEKDTEIEAVCKFLHCTEEADLAQCDDESVPKMKYNFTSIGSLEELQKDEMCGESALRVLSGRKHTEHSQTSSASSRRSMNSVLSPRKPPTSLLPNATFSSSISLVSLCA